MELVPLKNGKWLTVRTAEPDDAAAILRLARRVGEETDFLRISGYGFGCNEEMQREAIAYMLADEKSLMALGIIDGEPIGFFKVDTERGGRVDQNATLGLAIVKDSWHLGIGAIFMVVALDFASSVGYRKISLDVRADNERAIRLYKRFGFYECGLRREHLFIRGEYYDEMIMEKLL